MHQEIQIKDELINSFDQRNEDPVPELTHQKEEETENLYNDIDHNLFKTSNRLMDDIKADLLFILNDDPNGQFKSGILKEFPINYSKKLASIKHNSYDIYTLNQEIPFAPSVEHIHSKSNPNDRIVIIRSMLFNTSESSLTRSRVFHIKLLIKIKEYTKNKSVSKNEYHLVEELTKEDSKDLIEYESIKGQNVEDRVKSLLPKLVDSANYVCSKTNKILRIEISEPEFDQDDLYDFEIGPINVRYNKAIAEYPNLNPSISSPSSCLFTLFKAIKGPLTALPTDSVKSIELNNKVLNSKINPKILTKNLKFDVDSNAFFPPNFSDYQSNVSSSVIRESYVRKIHEVSLLGTKSYSGNNENPFHGMISFVKDLNLIFHQLDDNASIRYHEYIKSEPFINLSVYPFYSDEFIKICFENYINSDPKNSTHYFDSLKDISTFKATYKLSTMVAQLSNAGYVGQRDIDTSYRSLGIDPEHGSLADDDLLITMYKNETELHPLDAKIRSSLQLISKIRKSNKLSRFLKYEPMNLKDSYDLLEIDSHMDDDIVITALMIKLTDEPTSKIDILNRAFITIAIKRKSFKLLNKMETDYPDIYDPISFKEACQYLGVDETADEMQIITIFQVGQYEITKARNSLRVIAEHKNSKVIKAFLETGLINHNLLPASNWPVGLNNIGNTCYLNSLLQYYFSIKPLRDVILNFQDVYNGEDIYQNRRIGGRLVGESEVERSFQFTYHLRDLFYDQIHSQLRCITPKKELAYLAFLPSVTSVEFEQERKKIENPFDESNEPAFVELDENKENDVEIIDKPHDVDLIEIDSNSDNDDDLIIVSEVENTDSKSEDYMVLETSPTKKVENLNIEDDEEIAKPKEAKVAKICETEMETAYEIGRQQDVTECIGNVLSQIEAALKPEGFDELDSEQNDLVKKLFFGKTVQHLIDVNDSNVKRDKIDRFTNLFVNISDKPRNIYEAFDLVFKSEELTIDSGVFNRSERITNLPIILQVQIQRVYFDRVQLRPYKSIEPLSFPENLYMDRYFDTENPEILAKRKQVDDWKLEILNLKERREKLLAKDGNGVSFKDSLKVTKEWLESAQLAQPETLKVLSDQILKIDNELIDIYNRIESLEKKIDHQYDDFKEHGYSIFAIFIHRGEANYGHYWIYIKDSKSEIYRKYNDEVVSEVTKNEVFNFEEGNTATPYFLGYIKNGYEDQIEPLCRVLKEENELITVM